MLWLIILSHVQAASTTLIFYSMAQQPLLGQGLLIIEASRLHLETPQSVGLLWTSDQPDAQTSTLQYTALIKDKILATGGIRTRNLSKRAAAEPPQSHAFDRAATAICYTVLYQEESYKTPECCFS